MNTTPYADNWDGLPPSAQSALIPILTLFEEAADLLFDRRLNLSFESAVKELNIPGVIALTNGLRDLRDLLLTRVMVNDAGEGRLLFDGTLPLTAYDLPLYAPAVYLSQLAQFMDGQNVRVWKEATAEEITGVLLVMTRYVRPDIGTAQVLIAAMHDMAYLYPSVLSLIEAAAVQTEWPNTALIAGPAARLAKRNARP